MPIPEYEARSVPEGQATPGMSIEIPTNPIGAALRSAGNDARQIIQTWQRDREVERRKQGDLDAARVWSDVNVGAAKELAELDQTPDGDSAGKAAAIWQRWADDLSKDLPSDARENIRNQAALRSATEIQRRSGDDAQFRWFGSVRGLNEAIDAAGQAIQANPSDETFADQVQATTGYLEALKSSGTIADRKNADTLYRAATTKLLGSYADVLQRTDPKLLKKRMEDPKDRVFGKMPQAEKSSYINAAERESLNRNPVERSALARDITAIQNRLGEGHEVEPGVVESTLQRAAEFHAPDVVESMRQGFQQAATAGKVVRAAIGQMPARMGELALPPPSAKKPVTSRPPRRVLGNNRNLQGSMNQALGFGVGTPVEMTSEQKDRLAVAAKRGSTVPVALEASGPPAKAETLPTGKQPEGPDATLFEPSTNPILQFADAIADEQFPESHLSAKDSPGKENWYGYVSVDVDDEALAGRWLVSPQMPGIVFRSSSRVLPKGQGAAVAAEAPPADGISFRAIDFSEAAFVSSGGESAEQIDESADVAANEAMAHGLGPAAAEDVRSSVQRGLREQQRQQRAGVVDAMQHYQAQRQGLARAQKAFQADPYSHFLSNSAVQQIITEVPEGAPPETMTAALQRVDNAILALQRTSLVPPDQINVMPTAEAKEWAQELTDLATPLVSDPSAAGAQSSAGVIQKVVQLEDRYGDNLGLAMEQIRRSGGSDAMNRLEPLLWYTADVTKMKAIANGVLVTKEVTESLEARTFKKSSDKREFTKDLVDAKATKAYVADLFAGDPGNRVASARHTAMMANLHNYALSRAVNNVSPEKAAEEFFGAFIPVQVADSTLMMPRQVLGPDKLPRKVTPQDAVAAGRFLSKTEQDVLSAVAHEKSMVLAGRSVIIEVPGIAPESLDRRVAAADLQAIVRTTGQWVRDQERQGVFFTVRDPLTGGQSPVMVRGVGNTTGKRQPLYVPYWAAIDFGDGLKPTGTPFTGGFSRLD